MKLIFNLLLYFLVALLVVHNHLALALFAVALFTFRVGAVWLIPLAFGIDGYFGAFHTVPLFSIFATGWYLLSEFVRPQLTLQYKQYGKTT